MTDRHSLPQPGDIGLTQIPGPVGWLIQFGQWLNGDGFGQFQHAFIVLPDSQLIEADPHGARVMPLSEYDGQQTVYVAPPGLTDTQRQAICAAARGIIGVPYSFFDYLSLALARFHLRPRFVRQYIASNNHMICSQAVDYCYLQAGVHLFRDGRIPGDVTPAELYNLLAGGINGAEDGGGRS